MENGLSTFFTRVLAFSFGFEVLWLCAIRTGTSACSAAMSVNTLTGVVPFCWTRR